MSPKYKLMYFNTLGRAEHIRYIFAYAGQEYEDCRINKDEWPTLKPKTPFGTLPVLAIDGKMVSQSNAIAKYLAKQFGLLGKDNFEDLQADALVDTLEDYRLGVRLAREQNPGAITELKKRQAFYLEKYEQILARNPSGFFVGSQLTWADLTFAAAFSGLLERDPEALKSYLALSAFVEKINTLPNIKAWLQRRPKSDPPII